MFWKRCDKIISSGGLVDCPNCPCPSYIYVTKCYTTDGQPDCDSCDPEGAASLASLAVLYESQSGDCIITGNGKYKLGREYPNGEHQTFRYAAIEQDGSGIKKYPTQARGEAEWSQHPLSYWGALVIEACNCCCILGARLQVEFDIQTIGIWDGRSSSDLYTKHINHVTGNCLVDTQIDQLSIDIYDFRISVFYQYNDDIHECVHEGIDERKGALTFTFEKSDDCTELILVGITWTSAITKDEESECSFGYARFNVLEEMAGPCYVSSPKESLYLTGNWSAGCHEIEYPYEDSPDHSDNTVTATLNITKVENTTPSPTPSLYSETYNKLDERLK